MLMYATRDCQPAPTATPNEVLSWKKLRDLTQIHMLSKLCLKNCIQLVKEDVIPDLVM